MNVKVAFVSAALSCLGVPFCAHCAGQKAPSDGKAVQSRRCLLLAEECVKIGSSKNEMIQYQSVGNLSGGANYDLARRYFRSAEQALKHETGRQPLDQQPLPMRRQAASILGERGWFLYNTSAGSDKEEAAHLISRATTLDPTNATLQFETAAILVDHYESGGQKDQRLLKDVKAHLDRAIALGPDEAAPAFFTLGILAASDGNQLPQVGKNYTRFLAHAQGLNPEIYLYDVAKIEERSRIALGDARRYAPSLSHRLGPHVLPDILAKVKAAIAKTGQV